MINNVLCNVENIIIVQSIIYHRIGPLIDKCYIKTKPMHLRTFVTSMSVLHMRKGTMFW